MAVLPVSPIAFYTSVLYYLSNVYSSQHHSIHHIDGKSSASALQLEVDNWSALQMKAVDWYFPFLFTLLSHQPVRIHIRHISHNYHLI